MHAWVVSDESSGSQLASLTMPAETAGTSFHRPRSREEWTLIPEDATGGARPRQLFSSRLSVKQMTSMAECWSEFSNRQFLGSGAVCEAA